MCAQPLFYGCFQPFIGAGRNLKNLRKHLVNPSLALVYPSAETWPSGRRRSPAKGVGPEGSRGFESLRLRHYPRYAVISI